MESLREPETLAGHEVQMRLPCPLTDSRTKPFVAASVGRGRVEIRSFGWKGKDKGWAGCPTALREFGFHDADEGSGWDDASEIEAGLCKQGAVLGFGALLA